MGVFLLLVSRFWRQWVEVWSPEPAVEWRFSCREEVLSRKICFRSLANRSQRSLEKTCGLEIKASSRFKDNGGQKTSACAIEEFHSAFTWFQKRNTLSVLT